MLVVLGISTLSSTAFAQVPQHLNHQGILTNNQGVIVPDGAYVIEFQIYDTPSASTTPLFEQQLTVNVVNGLYNVLLSDNAGGTLAEAFSGATRYLQLRIVTSPGATYDNVVLSPRQQIASVPYALVAGRVAEEDVAPPIETLAGSRSAPFEYVNTSTVRLAEGPGGSVRVEIDGVFVNAATAVTFVLPTHLDTGVEAASTWYYCYARNIGDVLTPVISIQPPLRADGTKIGYHSTISDARFVQAFYNDNQSNIVPFDETTAREVLLRSTAAGTLASFFVDSVGGATSNTAYTVRSLGARVPPGARAVRLLAWGAATRNHFYYARASLVGSSPSTFPAVNRLPIRDAGDASNHTGSLLFELSLSDPSSPSYAWATVNIGGQSISVHEVIVTGWRF
ncbi:MAG: hypothetical protein WEF50_04830 [Myxococcota bacterium]